MPLMSAIDAYNLHLEGEKVTKALTENKTTVDTSDIDEIKQIQREREFVAREYAIFRDGVKPALLEEVLYAFLEKCTPEVLGAENMRRALVKNYIQENGAVQILNKMRNKSVLLSELYGVVNSTFAAVLEATDEKDPDTFKVDPSIMDDFYTKLDTTELKDVADQIQARVQTAMDDFIKVNAENKAKIENIIDATKEKIDQVKEPINGDDDIVSKEDIKESVNMSGKAKINEIREGRMSVLEYVIRNVAKSTVKNPDKIDVCMTEGKVDMDKVIKFSSVVYSMFEMVNTAKLADVNEEYVKETLESL